MLRNNKELNAIGAFSAVFVVAPMATLMIARRSVSSNAYGPNVKDESMSGGMEGMEGMEEMSMKDTLKGEDTGKHYRHGLRNWFGNWRGWV